MNLLQLSDVTNHVRTIGLCPPCSHHSRTCNISGRDQLHGVIKNGSEAGSKFRRGVRSTGSPQVYKGDGKVDRDERSPLISLECPS